MSVEGAKAGGGSFRNTPDNLRSNDQMEALLGVCAGPVVGPTRGLKSITIDGTPIEDESGSMNFQEFTAFVADGDPAKHPQQPTMQLGGGSTPVSVGLTISNPNAPGGGPGPWVSKTIANTGADALDIRVIVSQLFRQDKKGIYSTTANLEIQMKPTGTTNWINPTQGTPTGTYSETGTPITFSGTEVVGYIPESYYDGTGSWQAPASPYFSIAGKTTSPYVWELRVAVPNEGAYAGVGWDVRMRLIEPETVDADPNQERRTLSWESLAVVYLDPLGGTEAWRGLAWMYLFGRASDQLTGVPEVMGEWDTKIVSVPPITVYEPATRQYLSAIWDGSYAKAFTTDPAWIINDAISDPLWGISYVAPGSYLNKWDALEASQYFSELVPDGNGGEECRYSLNLVVDQPQKADEFIQYLAGAVGAIAWDTGNGEWRLKVDKPETPVDVFTLENIEGDFNYTHSDIDTRYNDITMSYLNKEFGYREDRVRVWDQDHIDQYGRKPTTLVAVGCTGRQEAFRRAMLRLRTSINEWRTVSFVTNRRGRLIRPLDTILVADSGLGYQLPTGVGSSNPGDLDLTNNRTTGRVIAYSNTSGNKITLRDSVRLEIGANYTLSFTLPNPTYDPNSTNTDRNLPTVVHTVDIINSSGQRGDVTEVYLQPTLPAAIPVGTVVAISAAGLPAMPKAYRVLSVKPDDDGERMAISAIEIDSGKWDAADNVDPEAIASQLPDVITPTPLPPASGDIITPSLIPTDGVVDKRLLTINWQRPSSLFITGFKLGYKFNGGTLIVLADNFQDTTFEMQDPPDGEYEFFIWAIDRRGQLSQPLTASINLDELDFRAGGISPGANRISYSQFEAGTRGWEIVANPSTLTAALNAVEADGYQTLDLSFTSTAASQYVTVGTDNGYYFPVTGLERLSAQALVKLAGPVDSYSLAVAFYDSLGDFISRSTIAGPSGTGFVAVEGFIDVPATALTAGLELKVTASGAGTPSAKLARPMVTQAGPAQTTFPSFTPGPNADNGATRIAFLGDWEDGTDYREGDLVSFGGASYGCKVPHTASVGNQPPNTTYWALFGASAYSAILTNDSHTLAADANGVVADYSTAGGDFRVYLGGQEITTGITFSVAASSGVTISIASTGIYTVTAMSADYGSATLRAVHAGVTIDKIYSVSKARAGVGGVTFLLTNDAHNVPTDSNGNGGDFSTATGLVRVFNATTDLISGATIGTPVAVGCTGQVNTAANTPIAGQPKGYYRVTAMSADTATLTIPVTYSGQTANLVFSLSKARAGAGGAAAKTITLTADKQTLTYDSSGNANPSTQVINFTAYKQNSTATVQWNVYAANGEARGNTSTFITSSGDTATINVTQFNNGRNSTLGLTEGIIVKATITDGAAINDWISVVKVQEGAASKSLMVISDRQGISYDQNGLPNPTTQTTNFIAIKQNTTSTVTWSVTDANGVARTPVTSYLSAATGDTVTMTEAQFASARNGTSGVIVTGTLTDGVTLTDKISVLRVAEGAAAVGFVQDSPTPSAQFVNQTWYKPTLKEWYRASTVGTGGWIRILGNLSGLDTVGTGQIDANAVTQSVSTTPSPANFSLGGSESSTLRPVITLDITTVGGKVNIIGEIITYISATFSGQPAGTEFSGRMAITRGPTSTAITTGVGGTSYNTYIGVGGVSVLVAPFTARTWVYNGAGTNYRSEDVLTQLEALDAPSAGSYRYTIWMGPVTSDAVFGTRNRQFMKLMELKR